ncbi:MAG: DUF1707 SHOCT-like domain-containing protein [Actinocrinis sp.]
MTYTPGTNAPVTADPPRPPADGAIRASDTERDAALRELGQHYAAGRLDRAEFDERSNAAFAARTRADLHRLFADLPGISSGHDEALAPRGDGRTDPWRPGGFAPVGRGSFAAVPPVVLVAIASALLAVTVAVSTRGQVHFPFPLIPVLFILARRAWRRNRKAGS